jgi:hypothetical protein
MIIVPELSLETHEPRTHPWTYADYEGGGRYYDFKTSPHLVSEVLEDFKPYSQEKPILTFYEYLKWLNGPESELESNDCAFRGPHDNEDDFSDNKYRCSGRLEILFREIDANLNPPHIVWLQRELFFNVCAINPLFQDGFIEVGTRPTIYLNLTDAGSEHSGQRLQLQFFAYGNGLKEAFNNTNTLFESLFLASKNICAKMSPV